MSEQPVADVDSTETLATDEAAPVTSNDVGIILAPTPEDTAKYVITVDVNKKGLDILVANVKVWRRTKAKSFAAGDISLSWCSTMGCMSLFDRESHYLSDEEQYTVMKCGEDGKEVPIELQNKLISYYGETLTCGRCNAIIRREDLGTDNFYVLPSSTLATRVSTIWINTKAQADLHLRFYKQDYLKTYKRNLEGTFDTVNKKMARVYTDLRAGRASRESVYYALSAILKDAAAGKSLETTLTSLLRGA